MGTGWMEVVTNSAMVYIDDVRLQEDLAISPAQFFRRMALYVDLAIPMLNRPPELAAYLKEGLVKPEYEDFEWESTQASTGQETVVQTGVTGYALCSCVIREEDRHGNVTLRPYPEAVYQKETGAVTFPAQDRAGISYMLDFYNDGHFAGELTPSQLRLLGMAVAIVWDERFSRNWLNMQMKIHDSSFSTVNESTYTKEITARLRSNRAAFSDELWKYEQDCAYTKHVPPGRQTLV